MTLGIPGLFPPRNELVNYDYFDIANGVGVDIYYGFSMAGTPGTSTTIISSGMIHTTGDFVAVTNAGTYQEVFTIDFEIIFNMPKNIKGDILAQIPFGVIADGNISPLNFKSTLSVYHYDGSSATQMGSTVSSELREENVVQFEINSHLTMLKVNQATVKHFKKGEILRFTIKVYGKHTAGAGNQDVRGGVGNDPIDRTDAKIELDTATSTELQIIETNKPTKMEFHVPFVLPI